MQFRRLIFAPSATRPASSSEKPIHLYVTFCAAKISKNRLYFGWQRVRKITLSASAASRTSQ